MTMPKLKIYKDSEGQEMGYDLSALSKWMHRRQFQAAWREFILGQTGVIIDGHSVVYLDDVRRFLEGLPVID